MLKRLLTQYTALLFMCDAIIAQIALFAAVHLRFIIPLGQVVVPEWIGEFIYVPGWGMHVVVSLLWPIIFMLCSCYTQRHILLWIDELQRVLIAHGIATLSLAGLLYLAEVDLMRLIFAYFFVTSLVMLIGYRVLLRLWHSYSPIQSTLADRILVIGAGNIGQEIAAEFKQRQWPGMEFVKLVGFLDADPMTSNPSAAKLPILGTPEQATQIVEQYDIDEVIVTSPQETVFDLPTVIQQIGELPVRLRVAPQYIVPQYTEHSLRSATLDNLGKIPLVGIRDPAMDQQQQDLALLRDTLRSWNTHPVVGNFRSFITQDWVLLSGLFLVTMITRLFWIAAGPGGDPDIWRVIASAKHIAQTGDYVVSRLPGNPVHEYLTALVALRPSAVYSNGISVIFSGVATLFFALILKHFRIKQFLLIAFAFALTPVVYINSVSTIDYVLAVGFILGSTYFILIRRYILAGLLLGLAIGSRITSGAMLLPLTLWIFQARETRNGVFIKQWLRFGVTSLLIGALCYVPVIERYGLNFFTFADNRFYPSVSDLLYKSFIQVWGLLATVGLIVVLCFIPFTISHMREKFAQPLVKQGLVLALVTITLYIIAFLRLPHEPGYLIPLIPFFLLTLALLMPEHVIRIFAITLLLSPFFLTINKSQHLSLNKNRIELSGAIMQDNLQRKNSIEEMSRIVKSVDRLPEKSLIITGWKHSQILWQLETDGNGQNEYIHSIQDAATFKHYVEKGFKIYFLHGMDEFHLRALGFDLRAQGAYYLHLINEP